MKPLVPDPGCECKVCVQIRERIAQLPPSLLSATTVGLPVRPRDFGAYKGGWRVTVTDLPVRGPK